MKNEIERFVRWQKITIDQFTYVTNTLLVLSVGFLGYLFQIVSSHYQNINKGFIVISLIALVFSILVALVLAFNRLKDFRQTTRKIRKKDVSKADIDELGRISWCLLYIQIISFSVFIVLFVFLIFEMIN